MARDDAGVARRVGDRSVTQLRRAPSPICNQSIKILSQSVRSLAAQREQVDANS
jgi:hypothetical protein